MKYLRVAKKTKGLNFELDNGKKVWGTCVDDKEKNRKAEDIVNYASKYFKEGEECKVDYEYNEGRYTVKGIYKNKQQEEREPKKTEKKQEEKPKTEVKEEEYKPDIGNYQYRTHYETVEEYKAKQGAW